MEARGRLDSKTSQHKRKKNAEKYKTFIGNKEKGQGFADKRKRKIKYEYIKLRHKDKDVGKAQREVVEQIYTGESPDDVDNNPTKRKKTVTVNRISKLDSAKLHHQRRKEDKNKDRQEVLEKKVARDTALTQYRQKKLEKHKKMGKKTFRGQPVMKNQIESLLEKIQKQS